MAEKEKVHLYSILFAQFSELCAVLTDLATAVFTNISV